VRLYIADGGNHRILSYDNPRGSDTQADDVIGQVNFTSNGAGSGVSKVSGPQGLAVDPQGNLYVADLNNSRVLLFLAPLTTDLNADLIFGQPTPATAGCNSTGAVSDLTLCAARAVAVDAAGSLLVSDSGNNRLVVYLANKAPRALNARLLPAPPTTAADLALQYDYQDLDGDPERPPSVRWFKGTPPVEQLALDAQPAVPAAAMRRGEDWSVRLRPFDGFDLGDEVVLGPLTIQNGAPSVVAGPDFSLMIDQPGTLSATAADPDGDPVTFAWSQVSGPQASLSASGGQATFQPQAPGVHRFQVTASDGAATSAPAEVAVNVITHGADNHRPVAVAAVATARPTAGGLVELDGSGSSDPDPLDRLSYRWTVVAFPTGNPPSLQDEGSATPGFVPEVEGPYAFRLRVSDGDLESDPVDVGVPVRRAPGAFGCSAGGGEVSLFGGALALWVLAAGRRRRGAPSRVARRLPSRASVAVAPIPWAGRSSALAAMALISRARRNSVLAAAALISRARRSSVLAAAALISRARRSSALAAAALIAAGAAGAAGTSDKKPVNLALPPPPPGLTLTPSGPPIPELEEARQLYLNFEFDGVLPRLDRALAAPGITSSQRMEVYKLMAFTQAAFDNAAGAQEAFLRLLELEPRYQLSSSASPKLRGYYADAKKSFLARQVVKLQHQPPARSTSGATPSLEVAVTAGVDRVAGITLHYRLSGARDFSQLPMAPVRAGAYSAPVPNLFDVPSGVHTLEYVIRARDRDGVLLASAGSEQAPLKMEVETVTLDSRRPLFQRWETWAVVGAAAAAVAVPLLLRHDASVQPGSLGLERLP
ncbi:MAG TPA: Ig-like domain-containing protein, partial [Myxococcales bacterium]|nr:Ig-like domain-containing protein [Myxococcales bacterium]